jgi:SAM-dependent methyltransferase
MSSLLINESAFQAVCEDMNRLPGFVPSDPSWRLRRYEIDQVARKLPANGTLLDVGSGPGFVPRYFHKIGHKVISVDYPGAGGFDALKALMDAGIEGHYVHVGVDALPLPDETVDVVFVGNVIEHLPNSPRGFMADLKRVMKTGGFMVMDTKNALDLKTRLKVLFGVSNWAPLMSYYHLDFNPHHHKEYTLAELGQLFELTGFRNIER